jgi:predicted nucleic acid-binding Zn ribbon protein
VSWGPQPIGDEVRRELGRFGPAGGMAEIVEAWPAAVGESISRNAWPARVSRDGTLHVNTSSSAWSFELGLLQAQILERLRAALGAEAPKALRFAPGRLPEPASDAASDRPTATRKPSETERRMAEELAAPIEDENLRKIVAKAAAASLAKAP